MTGSAHHAEKSGAGFMEQAYIACSMAGRFFYVRWYGVLGS
jgi:hypothetical protein